MTVFAGPIITALFEFESELFPAAPNDATRYHNMDMIRNDIVQKPLIVRDQQNPNIRTAH